MSSPSISSDIYATQAHLNQVDAGDDNPLLVASFTLLSLVPNLRNLPFHDAVNQLQDQLVAEMRNFERRALGLGASKKEVDIAKCLLCPLLDETVLNTPWGSQSGWGHHSLSSLFLGKINLGQEFFQILDRLKEEPARNKHLLELAYLCLNLGFEGKYRYRENGLKALETQREELFFIVRGTEGDARPELSVHWQGISTKSNPLVQYVPLWVLAAVTGVLLMGIYMIFTVTLREKSDPLYDNLFEIAQGIEKTPPVELVRPIELQRLPATVAAQFEKILADDIVRKQVEVVDGSILRIFDIFSSGRAQISPEYNGLIAKIAGALRQTKVSAHISGHTDNQRLKFSNRFTSNWHLSQARAESVAEALAQQGVPKDRLRFEGMADKAPIDSNNTRAGRARNRRIDLYLR